LISVSELHPFEVYCYQNLINDKQLVLVGVMIETLRFIKTLQQKIKYFNKISTGRLENK